MAKKKTIHIEEKEIAITSIDDREYISLTDMAESDDIKNWLRNKNTVEFLGVWEQLHNPNFNWVEFDPIMREAGLNRFKLSAKQWVAKTNAIGLVAKAGRYGGTYAHKDIAFEFGAWISPMFKLLLIKEFDRLKQEEYSREQLEWNYQRFLSKVNYSLHTDSIKRNIVPRLGKGDKPHAFSSEADLLNVAVFGMTAKEYREQFPDAKGNLREGASIRQLTVMANMESMNSHLIEAGASQEARFMAILKEAQRQLEVFEEDRRLGE